MSASCMSMDGVIGDMTDIVNRYEKIDRMIRFEQAVSVASQTRNGFSRCRPTMNRENNNTKGKRK